MRFVILREAGGIGDVVRTLPVARGLKDRCPGARVEYVALAGYEGLVRLSPDVDAVHTVSERERRARDERPDPGRHAYLRRFGAGAVFIDLYCPAYRHEVRTDGAVTLDRVELFCRAAGVRPSTPRIVVPDGEREPQMNTDGHRWEGKHLSRHRSICVHLCPSVVGLAPCATHAARSWLGRARLVELALRLKRQTNRDIQDIQDSQRPKSSCPSCTSLLNVVGPRLVFFHSWKGPRPGRDEGSARDIGAHPALRLPWPRLAAAVAECDLVISVDTGIFHLAGALSVPTLGLFGPTSGEIMCRPYPTHTWLTARPSARELPPGCRPPCYCRRSRGYSPGSCGRAGCAILNRLDAAEIGARALALLADPSRRRTAHRRTRTPLAPISSMSPVLDGAPLSDRG